MNKLMVLIVSLLATATAMADQDASQICKGQFIYLTTTSSLDMPTLHTLRPVLRGAGMNVPPIEDLYQTARRGGHAMERIEFSKITLRANYTETELQCANTLNQLIQTWAKTSVGLEIPALKIVQSKVRRAAPYFEVTWGPELSQKLRELESKQDEMRILNK